MEITCQYCGTTATDRVMCPSCGRRMQPAGEPPAAPPPSAPPPAAPPPPPPYYPSAGYPAPSLGTGPWGGPLVPVVLFDREVTSRVSRLTVAFRLILAIPTILITIALTIAGAVVAFVAWFAAVFTARVPAGMYNFLGYVTAYYLRANSYLALLTDRWPTVSSGDPYPVAIRYPGPERLNRAAVFFRFILIVPAYIVNGVVGGGLAVLLFPFWLILLVLGRSPEPIFDATSAAVRYQTRVQAYLFLLTSAYPTQLFVPDQVDQGPQLPARPELLPPRRTTVGRRLLIGLVVLGVAAQVAQLTLRTVPAIVSAVRTAVAESDLSEAYTNLDLNQAPTCPPGAGTLRCRQAFDALQISALQTFDARVAGIDFPSTARPDVAVLRATTAQLIASYQQLATAPTIAAYDRTEIALPAAIIRFEDAEHVLDSELVG